MLQFKPVFMGQVHRHPVTVFSKARRSPPSLPLLVRSSPSEDHFLQRDRPIIQADDPILSPYIPIPQVPRAVPRATTSQKCVRTNDIENVGVTKRHHTFFEMLGNFSFGDYFKRDAIKWAWQLATEEFGLAPERVWVSVFNQDDEAYDIWRNEIGVPAERIQRLGEKDNFWAAGPTGPCGPCSELYYDFHPEKGPAGATVEDDDRFIEFYNLVFMEFSRGADGKLTPLANKNIDTGMGLERMAQILQRVPNNYETDLIFPIIEKAAQLAKVEYGKADEATRTRLKVIGDHTRAVVYLISDGVTPSNIGRGYIVRRLLRRVVRCGRMVGIATGGAAFTPKIAEVAIALSAEIDPNVAKNAARILAEFEREEMRFVQTLERGEALLEESLARALKAGASTLPGDEAFMLYDTYGFPVEITQEVALERGLAVDMKGFEKAMEEQVARSQASAVTTDLTAEDYAARVRMQSACINLQRHATLHPAASRHDAAPAQPSPNRSLCLPCSAPVLPARITC